MAKSSKLYEYCEHNITLPQFVKFLDALEHCKNFSALLILAPDRQVNPVADSVEIPPLERTHIRTLDIARILHDKTNLPNEWTILEQALQFTPGEWAQVVQMVLGQQSLLDVFVSALDTWSNHYHSTVGVLCDLLHSTGRQGDTGYKEYEFNGTFNTENGLQVNFYLTLTAALLTYRELSRDTVISSNASLEGHRTIKIQFKESTQETLIQMLINENFSELSKSTNVSLLLIYKLYSRGVIDVKFKEKLVSDSPALHPLC
jgi:hypothetical protein